MVPDERQPARNVAPFGDNLSRREIRAANLIVVIEYGTDDPRPSGSYQRSPFTLEEAPRLSSVDGGGLEQRMRVAA